MLKLDASAAQISVLALITDAYGSNGGIAQFNRDLCSAMALSACVSKLKIIARAGDTPSSDDLPETVNYRIAKRFGKVGFLVSALFAAIHLRPTIIVIGHINFCFVGVLLARLIGSRTILIVYGGEAWRARQSSSVNRSISRVDCVASISQLTMDRLSGWAHIDAHRRYILPCCVDLGRFTPGPQNDALVDAFRLTGKRVIMTMGRLATEEQAKGFDEVIAQLPRLIATIPNLVYVICGKGSDARRLRDKAAALGVSDQVIFTGFVPEDQKADFYRLADAYVMPSRGEGFGIVILEALACGVPVLGSSIDGTSEALMGGALGLCVDPRNADALCAGILETLPKGRSVEQPAGLCGFSVDAFKARVTSMFVQALR